ncbi:MAG: imidazole glycerol phosphate synthase subunit HisF [Lutibacter sp.]|nr:imidazole glycerol phosphate synthase subunit HisF [Lutibacter sp.]
MLRTRVIPSLLLYNGELVKSVNFSSEIYVGDPINAVRIFNEKSVDELCIFDIGATIENYEIDYFLLQDIASQANMPLTYGGGVKNINEVMKLVKMGFEKVCISTSAILNPNLIKEFSKQIGSQSMVICLDVKYSSQSNSGYDIYINRGTKKTSIDLIQFCKNAVELGVGEIILNSIDKDGTMTGYDLILASLIRKEVTCPLTFVGGAGSINHIQELENKIGIVGAAAGSLFVFKGINKAVLINYSKL